MQMLANASLQTRDLLSIATLLSVQGYRVAEVAVGRSGFHNGGSDIQIVGMNRGDKMDKQADE